MALSVFSKDAIILDPFAGSGTTAVAAKKLKLNFIAIDTNPEYKEIAEKRIADLEKEQKQARIEL